MLEAEGGREGVTVVGTLPCLGRGLPHAARELEQHTSPLRRRPPAAPDARKCAPHGCRFRDLDVQFSAGLFLSELSKNIIIKIMYAHCGKLGKCPRKRR